MSRSRYGIDSAGLDLARGIEFQCQLKPEEILGLAHLATAVILGADESIPALQFNVAGRVWGTKKYNPEKPHANREVQLCKGLTPAEIYVAPSENLTLPLLDSWNVAVKYYSPKSQIRVNEFSLALGGLVKFTDASPHAKYAHLLDKHSQDASLDITVHEPPIRRASLMASMDFTHLIKE